VRAGRLPQRDPQPLELAGVEAPRHAELLVAAGVQERAVGTHAPAQVAGRLLLVLGPPLVREQDLLGVAHANATSGGSGARGSCAG
jgi:hypothetical protein